MLMMGKKVSDSHSLYSGSHVKRQDTPIYVYLILEVQTTKIAESGKGLGWFLRATFSALL